MSRRIQVVLCCLGLVATACSSSTPAAKPAPKQPSTTTKAPTGSTATTSPASSTPKQVVIASPFQLPRGSARAALVADGDHLLLLGGFNSAKQTIAEILRIDPTTKSVTNAGSLNAAVHDAAGARVAGRPMVFGGGNSTETAGVQAVGADGRVSTIGKLPIPRSDLATATVSGRTFILGGYDGSTVRATTIATADGTTFQILGDLPTPVRYPAVAALGPKIYAIGGSTTGNTSGAVRAVQMLDTTTGTVTAIGELPEPLTDAVAATIRGHIYVFGGQLAGRISDQVWRLDVGPTGSGPVTLEPVATLPTPVTDAAVAVLGNTAYLVGGESPSVLSSITTLEIR